MFNRIFLIVLDSVGCGSLPDAAQYDDVGSNTLLHIFQNVKNFSLPNLFRLGLANVMGVDSSESVIGVYGKMAEKSAGKDTPSGHWEMAGAILKAPFPTFPQGFPDDLLRRFLKATNMKGYLGNKVASGTEIIKELGEEHVRTGFPIVYTSADSVFQIAAHEEKIPIEKQYEMCERTRAILLGKYNIGRVIARPFEGKPGKYKRTERRRDYSVMPPDGILNDVVSGAGMDVIGIGKIEDIFNHKGITRSFHTGNNLDGMKKIRELLLDKSWKGLLFANLVDFDMLFGHRRDVEGYYQALKTFDNGLGEYLMEFKEDEALFITADHGNDPVFKGTDHTREYVPLLGFSPAFKQGVNLGTRSTFADLGATIAEMLGVKKLANGKSFLKEILDYEKITNYQLAVRFLEKYNTKYSTDYKIVKCNSVKDVPDVICKDSKNNILNMELTRFEDYDGQIKHFNKIKKSRVGMINKGPESKDDKNFVCFTTDTLKNLKKRINDKIRKKYGRNAILVLWQPIWMPWDIKMELEDIKNKIIKELSYNPFDKGIWILCNEQEIIRID